MTDIGIFLALAAFVITLSRSLGCALRRRS